MGPANDDNDEPVDGVAMTAALTSLPKVGEVGLVFGQGRLDGLRRLDWHCAVARHARRFARETRFVTLEQHVGRVGAASGAMSLAYGLALLRHRSDDTGAFAGHPFFSWAISRDGKRGVAIAKGRP